MNSAETIVRRFLMTLETRDVTAASDCLAPDVEMIFPGGVCFSSLDELVEWARPRYRSVAKRLERVDSTSTAEGDVVVCQGTLYGIWPDGKTFENIRFADWFLIVEGLIRRQHVWNDLAEIRSKSSA